jgi:hypothetical protein
MEVSSGISLERVSPEENKVTVTHMASVPRKICSLAAPSPVKARNVSYSLLSPRVFSCQAWLYCRTNIDDPVCHKSLSPPWEHMPLSYN